MQAFRIRIDAVRSTSDVKAISRDFVLVPCEWKLAALEPLTRFSVRLKNHYYACELHLLENCVASNASFTQAVPSQSLLYHVNLEGEQVR